MDNSFSLEQMFGPVNHCVIGSNDSKITFANTSAKIEFGDDIVRKTPQNFFPPEVTDCTSKSFVVSTELCGKSTRIYTQRSDGESLHYIVIDGDVSSNVALTDRMLAFLRDATAGIKLSADRFLTKAEDGTALDSQLISIFYHYYYKLIRVVTQMDEASKLANSERLFTPVVTDMVALCKELSNTISIMCAPEKLNINFVSEKESLPANIDPELIELMLTNLISNSLKYTDEKCTIDFSLTGNKDKIFIALKDNSRGMASDKLASILNLPEKNEIPMCSDAGIGLGLYISHSITQLHKGVMLIESREDEGMNIRIVLPANISTVNELRSQRGVYRVSRSISPILTGLSDVLPADSFGLKYED